MLKNLFVSEVRIKILNLLLLNPEQEIHVRAIVRAVDAEINAVRRELNNLVDINLLTKRQSSNKIFYRANTQSPIYSEIVSLLSKEQGISKEIIENKSKLGNIEYAMVSIDFLKGRKSSKLDVDLFIVGDVNFEAISRIVKEYEKILDKEINYTTMTSKEFMFRKKKNDTFIFRVLSQGRSMLIGDEQSFYTTV